MSHLASCCQCLDVENRGQDGMGWEEGGGHVTLKELVSLREGMQKSPELFVVGVP